MKTVWKYEIGSMVTEVMVPCGAELLSVGFQETVDGPKPHLWALVDPEAQPVQRTFVVFATGQQFEHRGELTFVGTAHFPAPGHVSGELVYHLFELNLDATQEAAQEAAEMSSSDGLGA